jgi:hypothetical protein
MAKRLEDTVTLGAAWWRELGSFVIREIRQLTSAGQGVGGSFKQYSRGYRERKAELAPNWRHDERLAADRILEPRRDDRMACVRLEGRRKRGNGKGD